MMRLHESRASELRNRADMSQRFMAQHLGLARLANSRWQSGPNAPSSSQHSHGSAPGPASYLVGSFVPLHQLTCPGSLSITSDRYLLILASHAPSSFSPCLDADRSLPVHARHQRSSPIPGPISVTPSRRRRMPHLPRRTPASRTQWLRNRARSPRCRLHRHPLLLQRASFRRLPSSLSSVAFAGHRHARWLRERACCPTCHHHRVFRDGDGDGDSFIVVVVLVPSARALDPAPHHWHGGVPCQRKGLCWGGWNAAGMCHLLRGVCRWSRDGPFGVLVQVSQGMCFCVCYGHGCGDGFASRFCFYCSPFCFCFDGCFCFCFLADA